MTLTNGSANHQPNDVDGSSSSWDVLYCSHLWSNSNLRNAILNAPTTDTKPIKYCYTCRGKIRKYEVRSPITEFSPNNHSTPNAKVTTNDIDILIEEQQECNLLDNRNVFLSSNRDRKMLDTNTASVEDSQCIPSISQQIDTSLRQKYTSYEMRPNEINRRRLRKSLKGIGCMVNFKLTDSPVKKRKQIQACSISVMIVAIVVISFVLVNFTTPRFTRASSVASTTVVPTQIIDFNDTSSVNYRSNLLEDATHMIQTNSIVTKNDVVTTENYEVSTEPTTLISNIITKIRKNIKTNPKGSNVSEKTKEIINRDLSNTFCSCQTSQVCMLDENSGTAVCKEVVDAEDPTGCGGLCALETEACQLVDRARGVRVCRLLAAVACSAREWRCRNGLCVPAHARCDGIVQCYDRSDETQCECDLTKQFRCGHSISCFPNSKLCDGAIDCWDGFDEVNCTTECPGDQFTCTNGQCIASAQFCDGVADCTDGSDEPRGCGEQCGVTEMRCRNRRCVPRRAMCDGVDNCGDGSDELHCS